MNKKDAYTQKYRVRATIKLSPSGENLDKKSESHYGGQFGWKSGIDDRLLQTLKSDISGVVGRVVRYFIYWAHIWHLIKHLYLI